MNCQQDKQELPRIRHVTEMRLLIVFYLRHIIYTDHFFLVGKVLVRCFIRNLLSKIDLHKQVWKYTWPTIPLSQTNSIVFYKACEPLIDVKRDAICEVFSR